MDYYDQLRNLFGGAGAVVAGGGGLWLWLNYVRDVRKTYVSMMGDMSKKMDDQEARCTAEITRLEGRLAAYEKRDELNRNALDAMAGRLRQFEGWRAGQPPGATS